MNILASTKDKLYQLQHGRCAVCLQENTPLTVTQKYKSVHGEGFEISNLMLLCPNCNHQVDFRDFREIDLVNYLALLISKNSEFKSTKQEVKLSNDSALRADIEAQQNNGNILIIEVKTIPAYAPSRTDGLLLTLSHYKSLRPDAQMVFAFPGLFSKDLLDLFSSEGIEVWDQKVIASKFHKEITDNPHPLFSQLFGAPISTTAEEKFIDELLTIKPGKKDWYKYETLIARILDFLFSRTLSHPITNRPTASEINRRDIILPNYCETGFWLYLRHRYKADYIVVDAKNYSGLVDKTDILQIGNYLNNMAQGFLG